MPARRDEESDGDVEPPPLPPASSRNSAGRRSPPASPGTPHRPAPVADATAAVFAKYDASGAGALGDDDLLRLLHDLGYDADAEYLATLVSEFGRFDTNSDGLISLSEFPGLFEFGE